MMLSADMDNLTSYCSVAAAASLLQGSLTVLRGFCASTVPPGKCPDAQAHLTASHSLLAFGPVQVS